MDTTILFKAVIYKFNRPALGLLSTRIIQDLGTLMEYTVMYRNKFLAIFVHPDVELPEPFDFFSDEYESKPVIPESSEVIFISNNELLDQAIYGTNLEHLYNPELSEIFLKINEICQRSQAGELCIYYTYFKSKVVFSIVTDTQIQQIKYSRLRLDRQIPWFLEYMKDYEGRHMGI